MKKNVMLNNNILLLSIEKLKEELLMSNAVIREKIQLLEKMALDEMNG